MLLDYQYSIVPVGKYSQTFYRRLSVSIFKANTYLMLQFTAAVANLICSVFTGQCPCEFGLCMFCGIEIMCLDGS